MRGETLSMELRPECSSNFVRRHHTNSELLRLEIALFPLYCRILSVIGLLTPDDNWYIILSTYMSQHNPHDPDSKKAALRAAGALHPHPQLVHDTQFVHGEFFDPEDIVQVKYEMLRRHRVENTAVTEVARNFGASRQAFYAAEALFNRQGIAGLIPKRRGPRSAHKCTDDVLDFATQWMNQHPGEAKAHLGQAVAQRFGLTINPRSIDRALARRKKKRKAPSPEIPP